MQSKKPILGVISLGLLLGAGILFQDTSKPASPAVKAAEDSIPMSDQQIKLAGITFANAGAASIATVVRLPGEVKLNEDRTAHVVPRLPGVAESVSADLGQRVKKGQVLAVISSPELADLRSALLAAEKRLTLAKITFEREELLWRERISAERDYLQARQAFSEAEIQAQSAKSKLTALGADVSEGALNRYVLRAPFDSVVVEKHITQGEAVKEDANVFLLSDLSSVWVEVVVAARDIEAVRVGAAVEIRSGSTGSSAIGKVSYVGNLLGEQTRTAKARVVIDNPGTAWRPGLFVDVSLARGKKEVGVAVQAEAIHTLEGKPVVFTQAANGFKANAVRTGISDGRLVEILDGLPPGAAYAAAGSFVIKAQQGIASAEHGH
ncbi:efflux RND transporter periplasmic adaptor subunit [Pseudoduganella sp. RAF19]|uniref:efflux RND transporter periplasmic adaptor subunit n=2 Tax=unclassified Pseudoduganella TaxID=2637179 RepID=UPI003F952005